MPSFASREITHAKIDFLCYWLIHKEADNRVGQGGRTWQPFVGGKNCHENFRQARIYNFRDKDVVFAHNCKFANLTQ